MNFKSSNFKIYLGSTYLIVLFVGIYFLFYNFDVSDLTSYEFIKENKGLILKYKDNNIFFLTIVFFIIAVLLNLFLCPMLLPTLVIGFIFGKWLGTIILVFGNTLGGVLLFLLAKTFFSELIEKKLGIAPATFVTVALGSGIENIIDQNAELNFSSIFFSPEIYLPIIGFFILFIIAFVIKKLYFK